MKTIEQSYEMNASPEAVFEAFVNPEIVEEWSGSEATMSAEVGFAWSLWGGSIIGTNVEVVPNQKLVQDWKEEKWDKPSRVTFTLTANGKGTTVHLLHENIPDASANSIDGGWKEYYLGPMQALFALA